MGDVQVTCPTSHSFMGDIISVTYKACDGCRSFIGEHIGQSD